MSLRPKSVNFAEVSAKVLATTRKFFVADSATTREFQFMFQDVYALCTALPVPFAKDLHAALNAFLRAHAASELALLEGSSSNLLRVYRARFGQYVTGVAAIQQGFQYLNKETQAVPSVSSGFGGHYSPIAAAGVAAAAGAGAGTAKLPLVEVLAYRVWRECVFDPLASKLQHLMLLQITSDRTGDICDLSVLHDVLESLLTLSALEPNKMELYTAVFEGPFLAQTEQFYDREIAEVLDLQDFCSAVRKASARLLEEERRALRVVPPTTLPRLNDLCKRVLIARQLPRLQAECKSLLVRQQVADLVDVYSLMTRLNDGASIMIDALEKLIVEDGAQRMAPFLAEGAAVVPEQFTDVLLGLHAHFHGLVAAAFGLDLNFCAALDKGCRLVVNMRLPGPGQAPELLAKYCDGILRKGNKISVEEADLDHAMNKIMEIFRYIDDKDIFEKFYSKFLAKRLINGTSHSDDAEAGMISRLKQLCGFEYTSKLQKMFTDMALSESLNTQFAGSRQAGAGAGLSPAMHVLVLQSGAWPLGQAAPTDFRVPMAIEGGVAAFEAFYGTCHTGRKLTWLHHLGTADVKVAAAESTFELNVTVFQMAILLLFNDEASLTANQIQVATLLPLREIDRALRALLASKVLLGASELAESARLDPDFVVAVNPGFSSKKKKIKLSVGVQKETAQESATTRTAVSDDRKLFLQATIVRTMKTRQQLSYQLLINEVVEQSKHRFLPSVPQIKKNIEDLMEKQYLRRSDEDSSMLLYIA